MAFTGAACKVCGKPVVKASLCQTHYDRYWRNGHFDTLRPADWGMRDKHPFYERWKSFKRQGGRSKEWEDFWIFVKDVGEKPEGNYRLRRLDDEIPWGKENFLWHEVAGYTKGRAREDINEYMREWRKKNYARTRSAEMKRHRGMTIEEYNEKLEEQNGGCAICGGKESFMRLAIDHNHTTNANRGLLCGWCNTSLGKFKDSVTILQNAINYLNKYNTEDKYTDYKLIS